MTPPINYDIAALSGFKNALATGSRFVWLYEIEVPTATPTRYRFCAQTEPATFRGNDYSPFPITHDVMKEGATGDLPTLSMTVSNISREIAGTLETYNGLIGQAVKIMLVLAVNSYDTAPQFPEQAVLEWDFKITAMSIHLPLRGQCAQEPHLQAILPIQVPGCRLWLHRGALKLRQKP